MKFEELWSEIEKQKKLPEAAIDSIPNLLSEATKKILLTMKPSEVIVVVKDAINGIERGSIATLDSIVQENLADK